MTQYLKLNESLAFAKRLSSFVKPGDVLLFKGNLGTGKSTLIRKMIQVLVGQSIDVPSPTFTLVQAYEAPPLTLWHFDLYRLENPEEIYELGIEDAFDHGVSFIEWPERLGYLTPKDHLLIELAHGREPDERQITLTPTDTWIPRLKGLVEPSGLGRS